MPRDTGEACADNDIKQQKRIVLKLNNCVESLRS